MQCLVDCHLRATSKRGGWREGGLGAGGKGVGRKTSFDNMPLCLALMTPKAGRQKSKTISMLIVMVIKVLYYILMQSFKFTENNCITLIKSNSFSNAKQ